MSGKLLTVGEILVEIVATTKGEGFLTAQPLIGPFPSGAPAIFVDQVARIGAEAAILSRVGDDDFGTLNIKRLSDDGVDVSGIAVAPGEATGSAFVRYREDGSRAFVYNIAHSACGRLPMTPEAEALIDSCDHIHVMGTALSSPGLSAMTRAAIAQIKARGGTLSFDPNIRPEILNTPGLRDALDAVLDQTDLFLPLGRRTVPVHRGHHGRGCDCRASVAGHQRNRPETRRRWCQPFRRLGPGRCRAAAGRRGRSDRGR